MIKLIRHVFVQVIPTRKLGPRVSIVLVTLMSSMMSRPLENRKTKKIATQTQKSNRNSRFLFADQSTSSEILE